MKTRLLLSVLPLTCALAAPAASQSMTTRWALAGDYQGQTTSYLGLDTLSGDDSARRAIGLSVARQPSDGHAPMHQTAYIFDCGAQTVRETDYWFFESNLSLRNTLQGEEPGERWSEGSSIVQTMGQMACGQRQPGQVFPDIRAAIQYARQ